MNEVLDLDIDRIKPSATNPRKTFHGLDELGASIAQTGNVLQPVTVRPHPTLDGDIYELCLGERRWQASKLVKLRSIRALVVDWTDAQVVENQLVENVQRKDLQPLEEAEGYQQLIDRHGHTIDTLADKTGRSRAHLYGRLKLTKLAPAVKKALAEERIITSVAELIARIPVPKLQEQALKDALGGVTDWTASEALASIGIESETLSADGTRSAGVSQPLSFRAMQALIHRRYATRLELAKFPVADALLVPEAGACTTCPHRSGNQPELFPDLAKPADVCTNPPCFEAKTLAVWKLAAVDAVARGVAVVEGEQAKGVFDYDGTPSPRAQYIALDDELPWDLAKTPGKQPTWGKLLGKKHAVPTVLVQDPSGAPRELLDKAKAVEVLRAAGKLDTPKASTPSKSADPKQKDDRKKETAKRELKEAALVRVLAELAEAVAEVPEKKELPWWRWLTATVLATLDGDPGCDLVANRRGYTRHGQLQEAVEKAKGVGAVRGILLEVLVAQHGDNVISGYASTESKHAFEDALKLAGVDWDRALEAAKESAKAEADADQAKTKKAPAKAAGKRK